MKRAVIALLVALAAPAAAEPLPMRFAEQAPPLAPSHWGVTTDIAEVSDVQGRVFSMSLVAEAFKRRGGWVYGLQIGYLGWSDGYKRISWHRSQGGQPTNPIFTAAYWAAPSGAPDARFRLGVHLALMPGLTGGVPCDCDGVYDHEKRPSQIARFTAVPFTVPDESAGQLGVVARYDDGRVMAQAEAAIVGIAGHRGSDADTPNHGWFAGGVGVRITPEVAISAHTFAHRGKRAYEPYEHRLAVGGALHTERDGNMFSLRYDRRLDACYVGAWFPDDASGTCSRIVFDYARAF